MSIPSFYRLQVPKKFSQALLDALGGRPGGELLHLLQTAHADLKGLPDLPLLGGELDGGLGFVVLAEVAHPVILTDGSRIFTECEDFGQTNHVKIPLPLQLSQNCRVALSNRREKLISTLSEVA